MIIILYPSIPFQPFIRFSQYKSYIIPPGGHRGRFCHCPLTWIVRTVPWCRPSHLFHSIGEFPYPVKPYYTIVSSKPLGSNSVLFTIRLTLSLGRSISLPGGHRGRFCYCPLPWIVRTVPGVAHKKRRLLSQPSLHLHCNQPLYAFATHSPCRLQYSYAATTGSVTAKTISYLLLPTSYLFPPPTSYLNFPPTCRIAPIPPFQAKMVRCIAAHSSFY